MRYFSFCGIIISSENIPCKKCPVPVYGAGHLDERHSTFAAAGGQEDGMENLPDQGWILGLYWGHISHPWPPPSLDRQVEGDSGGRRVCAPALFDVYYLHEKSTTLWS